MYIISVADWERFDGSNDPEYQWNTGGFDAAVIDTKQPGSEWVLSGQLHSADYKEMGTPHIVNGLVYVFISHSDFQGFVTDKGELFHKAVAPSKDQTRGHYKIADLPVLETGRIIIADLCDLSKREPNTLKIYNCYKFETDAPLGVQDELKGVSFDTPCDGYYPISLHYDSEGKVDLITIQLIVSTQVQFEKDLALGNELNFCTICLLTPTPRAAIIGSIQYATS